MTPALPPAGFTLTVDQPGDDGRLREVLACQRHAAQKAHLGLRTLADDGNIAVASVVPAPDLAGNLTEVQRLGDIITSKWERGGDPHAGTQPFRRWSVKR
jgi:hypothetical protein